MLIYPRDVVSNTPMGLKRQAFVMMPFDTRLDKTYVAISEACKDRGIRCIRADSIFEQRPILTNIVEQICQSQILVADLTGKNPNVFYEVGIAHSTRRLEGIILISQTLDDVPFDLRHLPILLYDAEDHFKLQVELRQRIEVSLSVSDSYSTVRSLLHGAHFRHEIIDEFIDVAATASPGMLQNLASVIDRTLDDDEVFRETYWSVFASISELDPRFQELLQFLAMCLLTSDIAIRKNADFVEDQLTPVLAEDQKRETLSHPPIIANLCFVAIERNLLKEKCINWLITYLQNNRVAQVDVLRAKIESWLVNDRDQDVEAALVDKLSSSEPYVREAVTDILGARKNPQSYDRIAQQLEIEMNPYAGKSMISALSRSGDIRYAETIRSWAVRNRHMWGGEPTIPSLPQTAASALRGLGLDEGSVSDFLGEFSNDRS